MDDVQGDLLPFQSTLPRRERRTGCGAAGAVDHFNPRSREGSDAQCGKCVERRLDFNPRSREGSDLVALLPGHVPRISIHAPAKGATRITAHPSCGL